MMNTKLMRFDETILADRANLINNPAASPDVTFVVGSNEIEITAHKLFLASAGEVFKAMFSENFAADAKITIAVTDMEVDAFTQVNQSP
jgi:BTB/POZ domain